MLESHNIDKVPGTPITKAILNERLTLAAFSQLSGTMAGIPFVKIVVDRQTKNIHFINNNIYQFHSDYIAENILNVTAQSVNDTIDSFNHSVYLSEDKERRFFLGVVALNRRQDRRFFTLETVEIDNMSPEMLTQFFSYTKINLDQTIPFYFKPANHFQETFVTKLSTVTVPRIFNYELFSSASYIALNAGTTTGRLRLFRTELEYKHAKNTIEWYDILVMPRVPDDIPRVSGIINSNHTTPLSHTNVLATGWEIPNSIQIGIIDDLIKRGLDTQWVSYTVGNEATAVKLEKVDRPTDATLRPSWSVQSVRLEAPETVNTPILELSQLRMSDRFRYGTKAANLGELCHIQNSGSDRLVGFYKVKRPPRPNLLPHLSRMLGHDDMLDTALLSKAAVDFLKTRFIIPRGIAIPFSVQQSVLESSPKVQQLVGKLKMALELESKEIDPICLQLQQMIKNIRIPDQVRDYIDSMMANTLGGVSTFVVRSSSNAEDLEHFSAAGMYESIIHVNTVEKLFQAIRDVWASLISPRSVRLLHQVGISLDDCYMGVIVQEECASEMGGVLVTTNPMNRGDFRNVYINASMKSVTNVVHGTELPYQFLFNTVEGGGRTISLGDAKEDLSADRKALLQDLALAGRLLQSHFSKDYTFGSPIDIEWVTSKNDEGDPMIAIVQLRPYAK